MLIRFSFTNDLKTHRFISGKNKRSATNILCLVDVIRHSALAPAAR